VRLLVYSQDGQGLGHLRRTRNIALELLARAPDSRVLALADSPQAPFFDPVAGLDYATLPPVEKAGHGTWRSVAPGLGLDEALRMRTAAILAALDDFRPDAVLIDHLPVGVLGELRPVLERARAMTPRPRLFLSLRDILDEPARVVGLWRESDAYRYLTCYDAVLVHGCRDIHDAESAYELTPAARRLYFNNYVATNGAPATPAESNGTVRILAMAGGGKDAFTVFDALLSAVPRVLEHARVDVKLLVGPNMAEGDWETLRSRAERLPVQVLRHTRDVASLLKEASIVVTMAGYNTLCEVLRWRRKAIVVPRAGPSAEQRMRSRLFAERDLVRTIDPAELTTDGLALQIVRLLDDGSVPDLARIPPLDGAARSAATLLEQHPATNGHHAFDHAARKETAQS
jgi:predicted glycosyltransferase